MTIVIGLPSYNEAATVAEVTRTLDQGARQLCQAEIILVNADNGSPDGTREIFEATPTHHRKCSIDTAPELGKGYNVKRLIDFSARLNGKLLLFDTDVRSIEPDWVAAMLAPLQDRQIDFTTPMYQLSRYEGDITKQIVVPILYAIFGKTVCQPIGGEFGLSERFVQVLAGRKLPQAATRYGIDVYLTSSAFAESMSVEEVPLGLKHHAENLPKTVRMCAQVVESLLTMSCRQLGRRTDATVSSSEALSGTMGRYLDTLYFHDERPSDATLAAIAEQSASLLEADPWLAEKFLLPATDSRSWYGVLLPWLPTDVWAATLFRLLQLSRHDELQRLARLFSGIYGARLLSFWREVGQLADQEVEERLWRPAIELREKCMHF
jgi:hypothetical protein